MIFDQKDLMIGIQLQRICFFNHFGMHMVQVTKLHFLHDLNHTKIDHCKHFRIIAGTVVVEFTQLIGFCNGIQLMIFQLGIDVF